jgi:glutamate dehydrogenase
LGFAQSSIKDAKVMRTTRLNTRSNNKERCIANIQWLKEQLNPFFFTAMKDEHAALDILSRNLDALRHNRRIILADREDSLILALANKPGTLYETLHGIPEREISYAMITHSENVMPGMEETLEVQRFMYDRKNNEEINTEGEVYIPINVRRRILREIKANYPDFELNGFDRLLNILWLNNESYVRMSPPARVAQILSIYQQANLGGGLSLDVEPISEGKESRVLFAVANPPQKGFFLQVMEVFKRLGLGVNSAYCLTISNGIHPYFLGTFFVRRLDKLALDRDSALFPGLQQELYNIQILGTHSPTYKEFVATGVMSGMDASLINAFISFCQTNLGHNQPDRFGMEDVRSAFYSHPDITLLLLKLFRARFDPQQAKQTDVYDLLLAESHKAVAEYNTGHRYLDGVRRDIFFCCLLFIQYTMKTNFFVLEKQSLSFRIDPAYLAELGMNYTADLPQATPFRITFFSSRFGFGNHIGFSDIARGGWRTVIARTKDDLITNGNTLFREAFVLAHTQHLKNKDIYEGGSKMVIIMDASDLTNKNAEAETWRLYRLQHGVINAFLDIFVTENGVAKHPQVVDYYREDEPIELGPDENMHDVMVEEIARLSRKRGYVLGVGIMSSKKVGINHKEFGVTSVGVVKFAEITMAELGVDVRKDPFSVKFTGGTNGDVAGNAIRLLLERCPLVSIRLILDGTAALYDPMGANHDELRRILLKEDLHAFDPENLNPGAFLLFRSGNRIEGFKELYRKVSMTSSGLEEEWISIDEFSRLYSDLAFTVQADLFIPGGGRPETIDSCNCERFFLEDGTPSAKVMVEGANSFITPDARIQLQKRGVIVMRDASANKCGVIASSYEIISNLLFSEQEFLAEKDRYVNDVLEILETVAEYEARLILKRRRDNPSLLCTEISDEISTEINSHYARLFTFFQERPELCLQPFYRRAINGHLPAIIQTEPRYRNRIRRLPPKYLFAILAAEIGSSIVYRGNRDIAFEDEVKLHISRNFPPAARGISHRIHRQTF